MFLSGKGWPARNVDNLNAISEPHGPPWRVTGIASPFTFHGRAYRAVKLTICIHAMVFFYSAWRFAYTAFCTMILLHG
jgi:hypothetical protein